MAQRPTPTNVGGTINTGRLGGHTSPGSFAFHRKQSTLSARDTMASINAKYTEITRKLRGVTPTVIREALKPAFETSQNYVPVATGALKASGRIEVDSEGTRVRGYIIYGDSSSKYAALVHERIHIHHKSPTRAKFLQSAMEEEFDSFLVHIATAYVMNANL